MTLHVILFIYSISIYLFITPQYYTLNWSPKLPEKIKHALESKFTHCHGNNQITQILVPALVLIRESSSTETFTLSLIIHFFSVVSVVNLPQIGLCSQVIGCRPSCFVGGCLATYSALYGSLVWCSVTVIAIHILYYDTYVVFILYVSSIKRD